MILEKEDNMRYRGGFFRLYLNKNKKERGIWNTIIYLFQKMQRYDRNLLNYFYIYTLSNAFYSFLTILILPILIFILTNRYSMDKIISIVIILLLAEAFFLIISQYCYQIYWPRIIKLRTSFIEELNNKVMEMDFFQLEDTNVLDKIQKARYSISRNNIGVEAILTEIFTISSTLISFLGISFLLVKLNIFLFLIVLSFVIIKYITKVKIEKKNYCQYMLISEEERKINYINEQIKDKSTGKDIRLYKMQNWLINFYLDAINKKSKIISIIADNNNKMGQLNNMLDTFRIGITYFYLIYLVLNANWC